MSYHIHLSERQSRKCFFETEETNPLDMFVFANGKSVSRVEYEEGSHSILASPEDYTGDYQVIPYGDWFTPLPDPYSASDSEWWEAVDAEARDILLAQTPF